MRDPGSTLSEYFHDDGGRLYAIHRGSSWYYVATDQVGTPRAVTERIAAQYRKSSNTHLWQQDIGQQSGFRFADRFRRRIGRSGDESGSLGFRDYEPAVVAGRRGSEPIQWQTVRSLCLRRELPRWAPGSVRN